MIVLILRIWSAVNEFMEKNEPYLNSTKVKNTFFKVCKFREHYTLRSVTTFVHSGMILMMDRLNIKCHQVTVVHLELCEPVKTFRSSVLNRFGCKFSVK